ncbi:MAG: AraC family transcriptional regulator [Streptococcaceae bacterium]|jgi:AraC-like DNA-binding protein|nr:AraC family transcriptional regulator [Streptococcaceae bacterium]
MEEIINLLNTHAKGIGRFESEIPNLHISKRETTGGPFHSVSSIAFCMVVQGHKKLTIGNETVEYGPGQYFISSVNVPVVGFVHEASKEEPFLALVVELTNKQILKVMQEFSIHHEVKANQSDLGLFVSPLPFSLESAVTRLVRLLETPDDIAFMAPMIIKEIIYRVLQEPQGYKLSQIALKDTFTNKISVAIHYIMENYAESFSIEELAQVSNMSASTFHRHFKEVTAMSPIQFQKQIRLQNARTLLLNSFGATQAAFEVGYESSSQFSREYSRMFGKSPREDMKQARLAVLV